MNSYQERAPTPRNNCAMCCCKQIKNTNSLELVPSFDVTGDQYDLVVEKLNITLAKTALIEDIDYDRSRYSIASQQPSVSTQKETLSSYYGMIPAPHITQSTSRQLSTTADAQSMSTYYDMVPKTQRLTKLSEDAKEEEPSAEITHSCSSRKTSLVESPVDADVKSISKYYDMVPKSDNETYLKNDVHVYACKHAPSTMPSHFTTSKEEQIHSRIDREELAGKREDSQARIEESPDLDWPKTKFCCKDQNPKLVPKRLPEDETSYFAMVPMSGSTVQATSALRHSSGSFPGVARPQTRRAFRRPGDVEAAEDARLGATGAVSVMNVQSETNPFRQGPPEFVTLGKGRLYPVTYEESQQLHQYLNQFSSVFTYNLKDPIPKDPDAFIPRNYHSGKKKGNLAESVSQAGAYIPDFDVSKSRKLPVTKLVAKPQAPLPPPRPPPPRTVPPPPPPQLPPPPRTLPPPPPPQLPSPPRPPQPPQPPEPPEASSCPYVRQLENVRGGPLPGAQGSDGDSEDGLYEPIPQSRKRCVIM